MYVFPHTFRFFLAVCLILQKAMHWDLPHGTRLQGWYPPEANLLSQFSCCPQKPSHKYCICLNIRHKTHQKMGHSPDSGLQMCIRDSDKGGEGAGQPPEVAAQDGLPDGPATADGTNEKWSCHAPHHPVSPVKNGPGPVSYTHLDVYKRQD